MQRAIEPVLAFAQLVGRHTKRIVARCREMTVKIADTVFPFGLFSHSDDTEVVPPGGKRPVSLEGRAPSRPQPERP